MVRRTFRIVAVACVSLAVLTGCPKQPRTVVVDGKEIPYEEAAKNAFEAAEASYSKTNFKPALEKYEAFLKDFPKSSLADDAIFRIGLIHEQMGDVPNAGRAFGRIVSDYPGSDLASEARFKLGVAYFKAERWNDAVEMLKGYEKRASALDPKRLANARTLIAEGLERQNKPLDAAPYRLRAAKGLEDPVLAQWTREKALKALHGVQDVSLLDSLTKEFTGDPVEPDLMLELAEARYAAKDYPGALSIANTLLQMFPDSLVAPGARSILRRAGAREKVDARTIGVIVPLSGDYVGYGQKALFSILLAANVFGPDEPTGRVRIAIRDSAGDPGRAAAAVDSLFEEDGIVGIVGPLLSNETEAAAPRAQSLGVPLITLAQKKGLTDVGPFIFRNSMTNPMQAKAVAAYAFDKLGFKRFALMYPESAYGEELMNLFWDEVVARGGEVVGVEGYEPKENDFTNEVEDLVGRSSSFIPARKDEWEKLRQQARQEQQRTGKKPKDIHLPPVVDFDALFVPDDYLRVGQLLPFFALADVPIGGYLARNPNQRPVTPLGTSGWNNPQLIARGGRYVEGSVFVDAFYPESPEPQVKAFVENFVGVYLRVPDILDALSYDSAAIVVAAVRGGATSREKLREALDDAKNFKGVTGLAGFDANRDASRDLTVLTVIDKEIRPVSAIAPAPAP
jgi:branched-chain amino acid transport system substrate-binding protein